MSIDRKGTTLRAAGMIGVALLLGLVLWVQSMSAQESHGPDHDHSDPAHHGQDMTGKSIDPEQVQSVNPSGSVDGGVRIVEYDAFQYNFAPDPLVVLAGEEIRLLVKSRDVTHGMMIPEVDFSTDIQKGDRKAVEFRAPTTPGEYPVFCSVFCGPGHGQMKGRLVVLPALTAEQATCPVMEGTPVDKSIYTEYEGKRVYFCCKLCKQTFENSPTKYISKLPQFSVDAQVEAGKHGAHAQSDEDAPNKTKSKSPFNAYSLVKPLGIATYSCLIITVLLGLFRRKLRGRFLIVHRAFAFLTLALATTHATLIFLLQR